MIKGRVSLLFPFLLKLGMVFFTNPQLEFILFITLDFFPPEALCLYPIDSFKIKLVYLFTFKLVWLLVLVLGPGDGSYLTLSLHFFVVILSCP